VVHLSLLQGMGDRIGAKRETGHIELAEAHAQLIEKAGLPAHCPNSTKNLTVEQRRVEMSLSEETQSPAGSVTTYTESRCLETAA
jgi:hypothetical protein